MELHCPVICYYYAGKVKSLFSPETKFLVAKRSSDRKILAGKWEFGAAKPNGKEKMLDTIKREYLEDFGIHIDVVCSYCNSPSPISTYEVFRDGELHKGVILRGSIQDPENIRITSKHEAFMFDTAENILKVISQEDAVPGLIDILSKISWSRL